MAATSSKLKTRAKVTKKSVGGNTSGHKMSNPKKVKTAPKKSPAAQPSALRQKKKRKQRTYTDEELGIPKLNMITPVGVQRPKGKKKGKIYIDDKESMMTIFAMVNAEKEGEIESKVMRTRQLEAIREARAKELEARQQSKRERIDELKDEERAKKNRKYTKSKVKSIDGQESDGFASKTKKRVSFLEP